MRLCPMEALHQFIRLREGPGPEGPEPPDLRPNRSGRPSRRTGYNEIKFLYNFILHINKMALAPLPGENGVAAGRGLAIPR
jgi:hypothetical protein